jgi:hypothetical protein
MFWIIPNPFSSFAPVPFPDKQAQLDNQPPLPYLSPQSGRQVRIVDLAVQQQFIVG